MFNPNTDKNAHLRRAIAFFFIPQKLPSASIGKFALALKDGGLDVLVIRLNGSPYSSCFFSKIR
jgi:hypothetical protein